jgi:hypothetical protein
VTRLRAGRSEIRILVGYKRFFLSPKSSRPILGPKQLAIQWAPSCFFSGRGGILTTYVHLPVVPTLRMNAASPPLPIFLNGVERENLLTASLKSNNTFRRGVVINSIANSRRIRAVGHTLQNVEGLNSRPVCISALCLYATIWLCLRPLRVTNEMLPVSALRLSLFFTIFFNYFLFLLRQYVAHCECGDNISS